MDKISLLFLLCVSLKCVFSEEIKDFIREQPAYLKPCKIYEPGFTKCSTESVQQLMTAVAKGLPELQGKVDSLDPLHLKLVQFTQNDDGPANIRANLTNLEVTGFSQMKIKESRVSKKDFSWLTTIYLPKVRLEGQYVMDGRILLLSLQGEGHMFIELYDLNVVMRTKNRLISRDGFTFYNITGLSTEIEIGNLKTRFDNLFGGNNEEVAQSTNDSFNQNWREFFESLRPLIQETVEQILFDILRKMFLIYPANFFVEDIPTPEKLYGKSSTNN